MQQEFSDTSEMPNFRAITTPKEARLSPKTSGPTVTCKSDKDEQFLLKQRDASSKGGRWNLKDKYTLQHCTVCKDLS